MAAGLYYGKGLETWQKVSRNNILCNFINVFKKSLTNVLEKEW